MKPHRDKMTENQATIVSVGLNDISAIGEDNLTQMADLLSTCMDAIESVVDYHGGHLVQFVGRNFLVAFNSRKKDKENAVAALEAILEIQSKLIKLSEELNSANLYSN